MAMNPARRGTPESEAVGSSEDERPWPSSTSFGRFPMKENSMPGMPGGIWSTQKRGSFKMSEAAQRKAAREARLGAVNPTHAAALRGTPSPSTDSPGSLPFAIPLQPTSKIGRSLSHSQGQREVLPGSGAHLSAGGHAAALPLGLLAEEVDTESESEVGSRLTHTTSHPPMASLMRTATLPAAYEYQGNGGDFHSSYSPPPSHPTLSRGRTFESAFANMSIDQPRQRTHWQTHLGWDDVPNVNESRRHSLADIPTRRGSLAGGEPSHLSMSFAPENAIEDEAVSDTHDQPLSRGQDVTSTNLIPAMYRAPVVELTARERGEIDARREQAAAQAAQWGPGAARPRKQLYVISFKCSRVDVFYLLDNTGLRVGEGDMVIVEADRGQDLGTVQHAKVTPDAARLLKKKYSEEQYKWLMMYSRNKDGGFNPNAQLHGENSGGAQLFPDAPATMQGTIPRDNFNNLKPKAIKRLANEHEIKMLAEKEGNEAKAKRACQQKVAHLRLQMEILDAEWQWDFQKLIFYYYADHYINFKDLITELYRIYKTRIWLSAINPASFSQHAMGQPPSGIGPGAVPPYNPYALNNTYTMAYGEDRDPYGTQMPYRIPYETYTPNYPAIPGVANSFAPFFPNGQNWLFHGQEGSSNQNAVVTSQQAGNDTTPTADPSAAGSRANHNDYGENMSGQAEQSTPRDLVPQSRAIPNPLDVSGMPLAGMPGNRPEHGFYTTQPASSLPAGRNWAFSSLNNPNPSGVVRQGNLPTPIGTARPNAYGVDYNHAGNNDRRQGHHVDWRHSHFSEASNDYTTSGPNSKTSGEGLNQATMNLQHDGDEAAGRFGTMNRFFAHLTNPVDSYHSELSQDR